jgi:hypothetical protein
MRIFHLDYHLTDMGHLDPRSFEYIVEIRMPLLLLLLSNFLWH